MQPEPGAAGGAGGAAVTELPDPQPWQAARSGGLTLRRVAGGFALAAALLPGLTIGLTSARSSLALIDEVLIYLLVVLAVAVVGGFWPSVLTALASDLLLNWYFTVPLHHWSIAAPADLVALVLFIACAVTVSSVVHYAARRARLASDRAAEAAALIELAGTVLSGRDSAPAVLAHLTGRLGIPAELYERHGEGWVRVAGQPGNATAVATAAGPAFRLITYGRPAGEQTRLLPAYAAQAAAACERQRLRVQAGQAQALAEGNRMRTALLAAVSHDLRSPLASVKAAVSTLRQTDIRLGPEDQAALLATIEEGADRLDGLIANLLDMSRIQTGSVQPLMRPVSLDEIVPLVVGGVDGGQRVVLDVPDTLPLVRADVGLLERALANIVGNALRYSPPERPPRLTGRPPGAGSAAVTVLVSDFGPGIPPAARERIFEPFQQLGDAPAADGVGLGLAVARGFLAAMGAAVAAEQTPGGGLTMRVELPVATLEPVSGRR